MAVLKNTYQASSLIEVVTAMVILTLLLTMSGAVANKLFQSGTTAVEHIAHARLQEVISSPRKYFEVDLKKPTYEIAFDDVRLVVNLEPLPDAVPLYSMQIKGYSQSGGFILEKTVIFNADE